MGVRPDAESPRELVDEAENHLRALLRDVLCGYLDPDLKGVADDILVEAGPEPFMGPEAGEIEARDLRKEPRFERAPEPVQEPAPQPYLDFGPDAEYEPEPDYEPAPDYEAELDAEPDTAELEAVTVAPEPVQHELDGVTQSVDFGWDDPEDFSAPV
jgi:hypothetical protein